MPVEQLGEAGQAAAQDREARLLRGRARAGRGCGSSTRWRRDRRRRRRPWRGRATRPRTATQDIVSSDASVCRPCRCRQTNRPVVRSPHPLPGGDARAAEPRAARHAWRSRRCPTGPLLRFGMPAWAPGSYMVRDFARHVYDLAVTDVRGRPLPVERLDKQRWEVAAGGQGGAHPLPGVRLRGDGAHLVLRRPPRLTGTAPACSSTSRTSWAGPARWRWCPAAAGRCRPRCRRSAAVRTVYRAAGYDELADSPFEVGTHERPRLPGAPGTASRWRCSAAPTPTCRACCGDLRKIVDRRRAQLFGGFPFDRYLFIMHNLAARGGGLEHAASTTLDIAGLGFEDDKSYQRFAELAAHEFFHAWNVKRIRDRVLGPFDYTRENYTRLLWFHEGFTEYMESILLLRAGLHRRRDLPGRPGRGLAQVPGPARAATSPRCPSCRSRPGSSCTSRPTTTPTARSATTRRESGRRWCWSCCCARPPRAAGAWKICSAGCGATSAQRDRGLTEADMRGGGGRRWPAGRSPPTSTATSGAPKSCRCRRCCGGRGWRWRSRRPGTTRTTSPSPGASGPGRASAGPVAAGRVGRPPRPTGR